MLVLYDSPVSGNCYKVRLLLAHLGVAYERREVDVVDRSRRPELLGELNPALRVPTLVLDDGRPLAESNAILWYFGDGTRFVPADRYERAQVLQWQFFEQYEHEPSLAVVRFWLAYSGEPDAYADRVESRRAAGYRALDAMERHLAGRAWLVGTRHDDRRHLALCVHPCRARGWIRPRRLSGDPGLARGRRRGAGARADRRLTSPAVVGSARLRQPAQTCHTHVSHV